MRTATRLVTAAAAVVGYVALTLAITAGIDLRERAAFHDAPARHAAFLAALDRGSAGDVRAAKGDKATRQCHAPQVRDPSHFSLHGVSSYATPLLKRTRGAFVHCERTEGPRVPMSDEPGLRLRISGAGH